MSDARGARIGAIPSVLLLTPLAWADMSEEEVKEELLKTSARAVEMLIGEMRRIRAGGADTDPQ